MLAIYIILLLYMSCFSQLKGNNTLKILERREVLQFKHYMVNLVQREYPVENGDWLCGGVRVTDMFILTSAACLMNVYNIYVIPEYTNVTRFSHHQSWCPIYAKRRVVQKCVPKHYRFDSKPANIWKNLDIALAKLDRPLSDTMLNSRCVFVSKNVAINYDMEWQKLDTNAFVIGYGQEKKYMTFTPQEPRVNEPHYRYTTTRIVDKSLCKQWYDKKFGPYIDKFMICADGDGNINVSADEINNLRYADSRTLKSRNEAHQKHSAKIGRNGFCQNNHGSPLVTFINGKETVIGIGSLFFLDPADNYARISAFLYTSTASLGSFIKCVLKPTTFDQTRRDDFDYDICNNLVKERGYEIIVSNISWTDYPTGYYATNNIDSFNKKRMTLDKLQNTTNTPIPNTEAGAIVRPRQGNIARQTSMSRRLSIPDLDNFTTSELHNLLSNIHSKDTKEPSTMTSPPAYDEENGKYDQDYSDIIKILNISENRYFTRPLILPITTPATTRRPKRKKTRSTSKASSISEANIISAVTTRRPKRKKTRSTSKASSTNEASSTRKASSTTETSSTRQKNKRIHLPTIVYRIRQSTASGWSKKESIKYVKARNQKPIRRPEAISR